MVVTSETKYCLYSISSILELIIISSIININVRSSSNSNNSSGSSNT